VPASLGAETLAAAERLLDRHRVPVLSAGA